ncbi:MAG: metallophosphoesterase [Clostridia bacterium]|nr:metallophosphoesterase [Clostridia bacterium]
MSLFSISDLHLSFSCDKPMDVFGGRWTNHAAKLEEYWRYLVNEDDTVVIPGDLSWGMNVEQAKADFDFIESLPGEKIILKGNHDYWWSTAAKLNAFIAEHGYKTLRFLHNGAVSAQGFIICGTRGWICEDKMRQDDIKVLNREAGRFELSLAEAKKLREEALIKGLDPELLAFFHYPALTLCASENPLLPIIKREGIKRVFYGHLHNVDPDALPHLWDGTRHTLVACDALDFTPYRISPRQA